MVEQLNAASGGMGMKMYLVTSTTKETSSAAKGVVESLLFRIYQDENAYMVMTSAEMMDMMDSMLGVLMTILVVIAAISLVVGGIGIMNIMLVTVTERTREIGIRKAIGAERKSIIAQFLIEACMICGIGGLFGIAAGYIGTLIVGKLSFKMILWPSPSVAVGSFFISVALGVIFGLYPAIKTSGLQPVDALRAD